jgi:hypothetical protein
VGYLQATVPEASRPRFARGAYELASAYWRQGIGCTTVSAMMRELQTSYGVEHCLATLKSVIHRSLRLLTALGFRRATADEVAAFSAYEATGRSPEGDECVMFRGQLIECVSPGADGFEFTPALRGPACC